MSNSTSTTKWMVQVVWISIGVPVALIFSALACGAFVLRPQAAKKQEKVVIEYAAQWEEMNPGASANVLRSVTQMLGTPGYAEVEVRQDGECEIHWLSFDSDYSSRVSKSECLK